MAVGEILSGAFTAIRRNPVATLGLSAILLSIYGVATTAFSLTVHREFGGVTFGQSLSDTQGRHVAIDALTVVLPAGLGLIALTILLQLVLTGLLTVVIGRGVLGQKVTMGEAWRLALPRLGAILGATVLSTLILLAPWVVITALVVLFVVVHVTAAAIAVGILGGIASFCLDIWFLIMFAMFVPAVVLERQGPVGGLRRSWRLVRRSFWRVFGILLLAGIIVAVAGGVLSLPFSIVGALVGGGSAGGSGGVLGAIAARSVAATIISAVGSVVAGAITRPISAGVAVLLYLDLRMRKEGLDLALQNAATSQMTGDEFETMWRPPADTPAPAAAPPSW
jgi:hypothetical protein